MAALFWILLFLIVYCYFGYPLLLVVWAKLKSWAVQKRPYTPTVSIVIAACNEEDVIERKIQNLMTLDYPKDKIEILIGSDGSTDRTNTILAGYKDAGIKAVFNSTRRGKMATVNDLVQMASHEIIVFTDARQTFASNAIRELMPSFSDPKVGCVSGELMFHSTQGATGKGVNLYWEYEKFMRRLESEIHSMLGATGAIYAIRRELFVPAPANVILDDMFVPFKIIEKGYRAVFEPNARAYDQVAQSAREEFSRKSRTLSGNFQIFQIFPYMFYPFKSPIAVQMFSHKFLRVTAPFFMILLFLVNLFLLDHKFYRIIFILQILFYTLALLGALARNPKYGILKPVSKVCYIPYVFCLLNYSALVGFFRHVMAKQDVTWQKAREV